MNMPKIKIRNYELYLELLNNRVCALYKKNTPTNTFIETSKEFSNILNCYCPYVHNEVFLFKVCADVYYKKIAHGHGITEEKTEDVFTSLMLFEKEIKESEILKHIEKDFRDTKRYGSNYVLKIFNISCISAENSLGKIFKIASC